MLGAPTRRAPGSLGVKALVCIIMILVFLVANIINYKETTFLRNQIMNQSGSTAKASDIKRSVAATSDMKVNDCLLQIAHVTDIKVYSQNDEDGALLQTLRCMGGHGTKEYFEFGSENGMEVNTRILRDIYGWKGHLLDGGNENDEINLHKEFFSPSNIVSLLEKYKASKSLDVLSIDSDYDDFYIMREILLAGYTPRILIVEFNSNLGNELAVTVTPTRPLEKKNENPNAGHYWKHNCYMGASAAALIMLADVFGYVPVWSNHVNLFFVNLALALKEDLLLPSVQNFPGPHPRRIHSNCDGEIWKLIDTNYTAYAALDLSLSHSEWSNGYRDIKLGFKNYGEDSDYGNGWREVFVID